jgi:nitric oxide reductase NorQ protein
MARTKSESTLWLESALTVNPDLRFAEAVAHPEYAAKGFNFDAAYFNAIKCRFKKSLLVGASVGTGGSVAVVSQLEQPVAAVDKQAYAYDADVAEMIPSSDPHYVLTGESISFFELVHKMSDKKNVNVRLVGPAGCGKTSFASEYAAKYGLPLMVVNCANVREPRDWFGYRKLDQDKNLVWHESLFVKMLETPNAVIVLDETNRCPMHTLNTLYPLLDHRRASYLEEANRTLTVAEGVTFWAAMNEGNQFTGTTQLDEAFADRTGIVHECKFLSVADETAVLHNRTGLDKANCLKLVEIADQVRKKALMDSGDSFSKPVSTRMLEEAASAFVIGGPSTMVYTLLNHFSSSGGNTSERHNLKTLLTGKFGQL